MERWPAAVVLACGTAAAQPPGAADRPLARATDDGYCDFVEGVAAAESDVLFAPDLFADFGYVNQPATSVNPDVQSTGLRLIGGLRWSLTNIYAGSATRGRAHADCKRHKALELVRGATMYKALAARARVLDEAVVEAEKIWAQQDDEFKAHRTTAQEATSTRLRLNELRDLATDTHRQMSAVPEPDGKLEGALIAYQRADDDMEEHEGKLRRISAFDISVRAGVDQFLDRDNPTPYFAVISARINLGALFQGDANDQAREARRRLVREGKDPLGVDATLSRLHTLVDEESKRLDETGALVADLGHQLDQLAKISGDESKRFRQTVWFDWVKARAEHAYLSAHLIAIHKVLGDAK